MSRGIPIGTHPSHVFAELSLIPIDDVLRVKGYSFCRYADDVHLFCESAESAHIALYELADALDTTQRLSLNRSKTDILKSDEFLERANAALIENPINDEEKEILRIIHAKDPNPYARVRLSDLTDSEVLAFSQARVEAILNAYLVPEQRNFVRIRWFLRRLAQVGAPGGVELVVRRIKDLLPAIGDAMGYLSSAAETYEGDWAAIGETLLAALSMPIVQKGEYLQIVLLSLFSRVPSLDHIGPLVRRYDISSPSVRREIILAAGAAKLDSWIRGQKESYPSLDPWLRRALIYSARALPEDERQYWLKFLKRGATSLEAAVIEAAR